MNGLSGFLLDLYKLTGRGPSLELGRQVFDLVQKSLPFDSGLWGTFTHTAEGPRPHWGYLHGLPADMLQEYENVKQHDVVNQRAVANCGRTLNVSLERSRQTAHPDIVRHARRWGMEHTLATMHLESPINLYTAVCLYRNDAKRPFTEAERRFNEAIVPHLVQAWHLNAFQFLDAPPAAPQGVPSARALVDRFGVLHNAEPSWSALLRREVAKWEGPYLPPPFVAAIQRGEQAYKGRALVMSLLGQLPDQLFLIGLRARAPIDQLSPRELMVAREFASGKTYKQIAGLFGTSPTTVRTQIQIIYTKLGIRTKVALARHVPH